MKTQFTLTAMALAALAPGLASAALILDPGTPPLTGTQAVVLNSSNWYAEEFNVTAGETITQLSAFLTQGVGQPGNTFTFDLYSASGTFLNATSSSRESPTLTAGGTFTANGWNTTDVDWTPTAGTYWLAVQVSSSTMTPGLDLPTESSASAAAASAPPLGFAFAGTSAKYQTAGAPDVGLQVTATPVPLPAAVWLLGSGLAGLAGWRRRSRSAASTSR